MRRVSDRAPYFATLVHRGRHSGVEYRTPLNVFPTNGGFVIALTYGRNVDWRRNLFAAGAADLIHRGSVLRIGSPRFIEADEARAVLPGFVRWSLLRLGVDEYVGVDQE